MNKNLSSEESVRKRNNVCDNKNIMWCMMNYIMEDFLSIVYLQGQGFDKPWKVNNNHGI